MHLGGGMIDEQIREEALDVLHSALDWETTPGIWSRVSHTLQSLQLAVDAEDSGAVKELTRVLEDLRLDSDRGNDAGKDSGTKATGVVRERLTDTIHKLGK